jgi:U6 snRNA-associated Sm-like protein LSm1
MLQTPGVRAKGQFKHTANLVLMDTVERLQSSNLWAEVPRGLFLIRGENVVLLGEIVSAREQERL